MRFIALFLLLAISLEAKDRLYKDVLGGLNATCKEGIDGSVTLLKRGKIFKTFNFKQEVDGGFSCKLYFSKNSNSFYAFVEDGLVRVDVDSNRRDLVVDYDGIGTLFGYRFNKDETKLLSWGGDINQVVKLTDLKSLKSKVVAKIDIAKVEKVIFSRDEKSAIIVHKDSTKRVVTLDK